MTQLRPAEIDTLLEQSTRLSDEEAQSLIKSIPGILYSKEHFVYAGWEHGDGYVNLRKLLGRTSILRRLCKELAYRLYESLKDDIDDLPLVIVGAETLGRDMGFFVAMTLEDLLGRNVNYAYISSSDNPDGTKNYSFNPKTDFVDFLTGAQAILVDDLGNAGSTIQDCSKIIRDLDCVLLGSGVLVDRGELTAEFLNVPSFIPLLSYDMPKMLADECSLCQSGVPVVADLARGKVWSTQNPDYPTKTVL